MQIHYNIRQGSEEWNAIRRGKITASNAAKIFTPGGKLSKQADDYMMGLIGECFATPDYERWAGNKFTDWGTAWEPVARKAWQRHVEFTGHPDKELTLQEVGFVSLDGPVGCSPDGLLFDGDKLAAGLEIKCPTIEKHATYAIIGELPDEYKVQVHFSMVVCGVPRWHFFSFFPGLMPVHLVVEQDDFTDRLAAATKEFVAKYAELWPTGIARIKQSADYEKAMEGLF